MNQLQQTDQSDIGLHRITLNAVNDGRRTIGSSHLAARSSRRHFGLDDRRERFEHVHVRALQLGPKRHRVAAQASLGRTVDWAASPRRNGKT